MIQYKKHNQKLLEKTMSLGSPQICEVKLGSHAKKSRESSLSLSLCN